MPGFGSWVTTSGNYSTVALHCAMEAMGSDRIMFSVDYPFENMDEAADWIETCDISEDDRSKIAYGNAKRLLKL
jgi:gamma-resorcylate decarboxylase